MHHPCDLIAIFKTCFEQKYNTQLVRGGDEPIYVPAIMAGDTHKIYFAHGYFSSALHECSHWFIAGEARRLLEDYGYWYEPDGRNNEQQQLFQQVEIKPQAVELLLSIAANYPFCFSFDNLTGETGDSDLFKTNVFNQAIQYAKNGLPQRAQQFYVAICTFYNTTHSANINQLYELSCNSGSLITIT